MLGHEGRCSENAARYAGPLFAYHEGRARRAGERWCSHAWLVHRRTGEIVDVTPPWHLTANEYDGSEIIAPRASLHAPAAWTDRAIEAERPMSVRPG